MKALLAAAVVVAGLVVARRRLVHLLTVTTGTWVGTPDA